MNEWYMLLKDNYNQNIGTYLEYFDKNCMGDIQNQIEVLYAILRLCVENDDRDAFQTIVQKVPLVQISNFEDYLFDNIDVRESVLSKYGFDDLSLWGAAISGRRKEMIKELKDHFLYTTCSLSRWMTEWDIVLTMKDGSDSYWEFCSDNIVTLDDAEQAFLLLLNGREGFAEKKLQELDFFDRKNILDQAQKDKEEKNFSWYTHSISTEVTIEQGEQLLNQLIEMISRINASSSWNCIGRIENIESKADDMCLIVKTDKCCYTAEIDTSRNCCEIYGGYIICEDDISEFIGSSLLRITLTDTALNSHIVLLTSQYVQ